MTIDKDKRIAELEAENKTYKPPTKMISFRIPVDKLGKIDSEVGVLGTTRTDFLIQSALLAIDRD